MTYVKSISVAVAGFVTGALLATAATASTYTGTYDAGNVETVGNPHTLWLVDFVDGSKYWQFEDGSNAFVFEDTTATLNAVAFQTGNANRRMDLSMTFELAAGPNGSPKCGGDCSDVANWNFFDFTSASLTGMDDLAGVILNLTLGAVDNGGRGPIDKLPQLGFGANDKDAGFGFSTWFNWERVMDLNQNPNFDVVQTGTSGHGDVNLQLDVTPVPLPAAGWLLIAGVGALGAVRKSRKT